MKRIFLSFIVIIFLFVGCSKNNPVESTVYSDSELQSKILGTWTNDYSTIRYNADGTFENTFEEHDFNDKVLKERITGTYSIENGILSYEINEFRILNDSTYNQSFFISIPKLKIKFEGNLLYGYPLDILKSTKGYQNTLWGKWTTEEWAVSYNPKAVNSIKIGLLRFEYNFNKDSMTVTYGSDFSADTTTTIYYTTEKINYNGSELSWGQYYKKRVEFRDGLMYMYQKLNGSPIPLRKAN